MKMLRSARKEKGLTMKELGAMVGVSESAISQYENGKREADFETLLKIGEVLDCSIDYLLRGFEQKETAPQEGGLTVTFDDFTYAMQNEGKTLTEMDKQILLSMAKQLNDARRKENGETD